MPPDRAVYGHPTLPSPEEPPVPEPDWLTEEIFVVEKFYSPRECADAIALSEQLGYEDALLTSPSGLVRRADIRNNERVIVDDADLAVKLWERIADFVPPEQEGFRAVGVNERFRFYRYDPGQQFDWHHDHPFERDDGAVSFWTFMIYLNEGFDGGETSFNDSYSDEPFDEFQVVPETGKALFFLHTVHHKGEPVLRGRKYVLRTDVLYAPPRRRRRRPRLR
jgi:predicted 2-oxoglutarate/Fe(II)-dependent dioxygenase YbiX